MGLAVAAVAIISLFPQSGVGPGAPICFVCGERAIADAILNLGFYLPLGAALALTPIRAGPAIVLACLLSAVMEAAQMALPGRYPSPLDVLTNTSGAALGLLVVRAKDWWIRPPARRASRLCLTSAVLVVAAFLMSAHLMGPEFLPGTYVGQWTLPVGRYERYGGAVRAVAIGPHQLPSTRLENSDGIRRLLEAGEPLRIWATAGSPPRSLSPIFALIRQYNTQLLLVGASGGDLALRIRQRGTAWRLDQHTRYARGLMADVEPGADFLVEIWRSGDRTCASVDGKQDCNVGPTIGDGWGLLINPRTDSWIAHSLLKVGWLALLTFPVGFWFRWDERSAAGLAIVIVGALVVPALTSLSPTPSLGWLGMALGMSAGVAIGQGFEGSAGERQGVG